MPKFNVEHQSGINAQEAFEKLKIYLGSNNEFSKLDPKMTCQFQDQKLEATLIGSQFKANLVVTPQANGSKTLVTVDIPFILLPFKGKIQETLEKQLKKHMV